MNDRLVIDTLRKVYLATLVEASTQQFAFGGPWRQTRNALHDIAYHLAVHNPKIADELYAAVNSPRLRAPVSFVADVQ